MRFCWTSGESNWSTTTILWYSIANWGLSNRIIVSANTIDKRLAETKGRDFVKRMQDSLPKLPGMGEHSGDKVVADSGATGEAIIKICELLFRFLISESAPNHPTLALLGLEADETQTKNGL